MTFDIDKLKFTKVCRLCKFSCKYEDRLLYFHSNPVMKDKCTSECKVCRNKISKEWREKHKEDPHRKVRRGSKYERGAYK